MHVRVRLAGKPECIVVVPSKLTKIEKFKQLIEDKFGIDPDSQRLLYGGKMLENGYSFHDYNIKLNDVIQLMQKASIPLATSNSKPVESEDIQEPTLPKITYKDAESKLYKIGDLVDVRERVHNAWFEGKIIQIVVDPEQKLESKPEIDQQTDSKSQEVDDTKNKISPSKDDNSSSVKENVPKANDHSSQAAKPESAASPAGKSQTPKRGIKDYFMKGNTKQEKDTKIVEKSEKKSSSSSKVDDKNEPPPESSDKADDCDEVGLLYKIQFIDEDEDTAQYCKLSEIRPRSRKEISTDDLTVSQTVMVNYNTEEPHEIGFWYDFTINEIKKNRKNVELIGTLYHGKDVPLDNVKVVVHDKIFAIESVISLSKRTSADDEVMTTATEKRASPLNCSKCRDKPDVSCKDCGCGICAGKNQPELIILCDECNQGYHMSCLEPPLDKVPEDDWYCSGCKRDTNEVVAPGAKKQQRKPNQGQKGRDWGRGMACVGKTQTSAMPANHFGPIPGTEVGMTWRFRIQLSESGIHRPPVSGIHGRDVEGAYSIVLSGGYEDDYDDGNEFTYTGSGGRDLSGNKRTADQSSDQTLTRENKALARNCAVKVITEEGADSKDKWREGKPVRVVRSYKMLKHFPQYAPKEGIRYDGIYKVVKYYPEVGKSGFRVWKYLLRRDDSNPAPWEKGAKEFPIIYPDGYLEAEAEKQAQKEREKMKKTPSKGRKRPLRESNQNGKDNQDGSDTEPTPNKKGSESSAPPAKKMRTRSSLCEEKVEDVKPKLTPKRKKSVEKTEKITSPTKVNPFMLAAKKSKSNVETKGNCGGTDVLSKGNCGGTDVLSKDDKEVIEKDECNKKLWDECLATLESDGKKGLVEKVTELFLCIICQEVVANPVTTGCSHNFCLPCLKLAFKSTESYNCPYCRTYLSKEELLPNDNLKAALRILLPGYDLCRK